MRRNPRALLLDLDDTLYPHRHFRASGFAAVARHVERFHGVPAGQAYRALIATSEGDTRGRELDGLIAQFGLRAPVGELIRVYRSHEPSLVLPPRTAATLRRLRRTWRLAIVTNGIPAIQAGKVAALGLGRFVDAVVLASECGSGEGKPDREPFLEALRRVDADPAHAVFVGDDAFCDIFGAMRCGLRTIQTLEWRQDAGTDSALHADATVQTISDVPDVADHIVPRRLVRHAA